MNQEVADRDVASGCEYEELAHTAEIGLRVRAPTPGLLFACAGVGMFALIGAQPAERSRCRSVAIESFDIESLFVDWLSELLYLSETTGEIYDRIEMTAWSPTQLEAVVYGGPAGRRPTLDIKAVTYHGLEIVETAGSWTATVYFDI